MIATLQAICYWFFELLTPPEIKQIRFITHDCVSKIIPSTRDEDGYPISGQDYGSIKRFSSLSWKKRKKRDSHAWHCVTTSVTVTCDIAWQVTRNDKTLRGVFVGCSCLALGLGLSPHRSEDLTADKAVVNSTFNLWERGWEPPLWAPPCHQ